MVAVTPVGAEGGGVVEEVRPSDSSVSKARYVELGAYLWNSTATTLVPATSIPALTGTRNSRTVSSAAVSRAVSAPRSGSRAAGRLSL